MSNRCLNFTVTENYSLKICLELGRPLHSGAPGLCPPHCYATAVWRLLVVTASHLNSAFKQMFSIRCRLHYNLIEVCKCCKNVIKRIFKGLTLAQCSNVQCRPTVERCRTLHSSYLHTGTPLMCIAP